MCVCALRSNVRRAREKNNNNNACRWLAFYELLTSTCLLDNMALDFHDNNGSFADREGVQTKSRDFGGLGGIDYGAARRPAAAPADRRVARSVDTTDDFFGWTIVFAEMTAKFKAVGYEEGVNLFGAPVCLGSRRLSARADGAARPV